MKKILVLALLLFCTNAFAVTINSNYDNGNGTADGTLESPANNINVQTVSDNVDNSSWKAWFNFVLSDVSGLTLTVHIDLDTLWTTRDDDIRPVYSEDDGATWDRVGSANLSGDTLTFSLPQMTSSTVQIAWDYPYTYTRMLADVDAWDDSVYVTTSEALSSGGVSASEDGRQVRHMTIEQPGFYSNRYRLILITGVHPGEVQGRWLLSGMIDWLLSDAVDAVAARKKSVIDIYPMINPDGVYEGRTRSYSTNLPHQPEDNDSEDWDANRKWSQSGPSTSLEPNETYLVHYDIHQYQNGVDLLVDMHGNYDPNPQFTEAAADPWSTDDKNLVLNNIADSQGYWQATFEVFAANTGGWRGGSELQYDMHILGTEGGVYTQDNGTYPEDVDREAAGEALVQVLIEQFEDATEDVTAPTVDSFIIPATSESLTVTITAFTGSDALGYDVKYLITESASEPATDHVGWTETPWTEFVFSTEGAKTLYAWTMDIPENISTSANDSVTITLAEDGSITWTGSGSATWSGGGSITWE